VRLLVDSRKRAAEPALDFVTTVDELGLKRALATPARAEDAIEMTKLRRSLTHGKLVGLALGELAERARAVGRVYITTMTSSKGLEFDVVVMVGIEQGKIPFFNSEGERLEEDRRKFYVSLTRARDAVHIFYSGWFVWERSGKVNREGPSTFLSELGLV
jgi:DNA helicase-2/ATP-dependent DNA helicase PcrA